MENLLRKMKKYIALCMRHLSSKNEVNKGRLMKQTV